MKNAQSYLPIFLQIGLLIIGYLFINSGLAIESNHQSLYSINKELTHSTPKNIEKVNKSDNISINDVTMESIKKTEELIEIADKEEEIIIEEWMVEANDENWDAKTIDKMEVEMEEEIPLEEWMTDLSYWND